MARRKKPTSCRPLKLTAAQAIELRAWYYSPRTVAEKARALGISRFALYNYVNFKHKPPKESIRDVEAELTTQSVKFHGEQRSSP